MTKKITLLFALMLSTLMASAHDIEVKNADGVTIYYNYFNNGTELEVSFRGTSYDSYNNEYSGNVVIPEEVTFMNRTRKVTSIGEWAFRGCSGLTSVTIPNSVTSIGNYAFYDCSSLTSVTIGSGVRGIGINAFNGCKSLTSVTIPNSVTSIEGGAFYNCSGLTSVTIGSGVTSIENSAFSGCKGLTSVTIPNSVTSIGEGAFYYCSGLTSVTIPNSVTSIGDWAFAGCSGLTSVTIGSGVRGIGINAFNGVDLPTVISLMENPCVIYGKTDLQQIFSQNTFMNATLYVPKGTKEKYKSTTGWKDFVFIEEGAGGGDTPETQKCATPTIIYENGKLSFSCETEGVKYVYNFSTPSESDEDGKGINTPNKLQVSVYAKKDGFENSDVATKEIDLGASGLRGDVNNDGTVSMPDAMFIVNKILNGKFPDGE